MFYLFKVGCSRSVIKKNGEKLAAIPHDKIFHGDFKYLFYYRKLKTLINLVDVQTESCIYSPQ